MKRSYFKFYQIFVFVSNRPDWMPHSHNTGRKTIKNQFSKFEKGTVPQNFSNNQNVLQTRSYQCIPICQIESQPYTLANKVDNVLNEYKMSVNFKHGPTAIKSILNLARIFTTFGAAISRSLSL